MTDTTTLVDERSAIANVYALLGRLWLQELDEPLLAEFESEPLRGAFQSVTGQELPTEELDHLAAEYCRLFVGPKEHFPPIQSVWQEGKLDSEISTSVRSFASAISYAPLSAYPNTLIDHLGIELEIMSRSLQLFSHQISNGIPSDETEAFAQEFFRRHLCWTDRFIAAAARSTELVFYKLLLNSTRDFLAAENEVWR